jgi:N-acetylated-alpha-linked acidic dipeptidase
MDGEVVPKDWRGALPITYHLGPGPARVRMKAEFNWDMVTAYNVIARLEGSEFPDEWVIRGNHQRWLESRRGRSVIRIDNNAGGSKSCR